jgi:hypothetical protein
MIRFLRSLARFPMDLFDVYRAMAGELVTRPAVESLALPYSIH